MESEGLSNSTDSLYSTYSSNDEFNNKPDVVCKDKNYAYFDKKAKIILKMKVIQIKNMHLSGWTFQIRTIKIQKF